MRHIIYGILLVLSVAVNSYTNTLDPFLPDFNSQADGIDAMVELVSSPDLFLEDAEDKMLIPLWGDDTNFVSNPNCVKYYALARVTNKALSPAYNTFHLLDLPPPFFL